MLKILSAFLLSFVAFAQAQTLTCTGGGCSGAITLPSGGGGSGGDIQFGGVCDTVTDNTAAWAAAIAAAQASTTTKTIVLPAGVCGFSSQPATIPHGINVRGQGINGSMLLRNYSSSQNFINITGRGSVLRDFSISTAQGTSGGAGVFILSTNANVGGYHHLENMWITGSGAPSGTWDIPIVINGQQSTTIPGARVVFMNNVTLFNGTAWGMNWADCVGCTMMGGGVYQGGGTTQTIWVGGSQSVSNCIIAHVPGGAASLVGMRTGCWIP